MPDLGASDNYVHPMAWEWVSSASTAAVGIAAIVGTNWASARSRKHESKMADKRQDHDRALSHEQWIREHRNDAYLHLLELSEQVGLYVQRVHPMWNSNPPQPDPDLPDHDAQLRVRAPIMAYGSQAVKDRMDEWNAFAHRAIYAAAAVSGHVEGARQQLADLRTEEQQARRALGTQIAAELQGNPGRDVERRPSDGS